MSTPQRGRELSAVDSKSTINEDRPGFQAVDRLVTIIDAVRDEAPASLARIARAVDLSEPTTLRYLAALQHHRIVRREPDSGAFSLGMRLYEWGESARGAYDPRQMAAPVLDNLWQEFGETVELAGREADGRLIVLDVRQGRHGISYLTRVGDIEPWHSTSLGKSLLAAMPEQQAHEVIKGLSLARFTEHTITKATALKRELAMTRERGYALDNQENEVGSRCVGVAVRDRSGEAAFAISVSGPIYRFTDEVMATIAYALQEAVSGLERAWGSDTL